MSEEVTFETVTEKVIDGLVKEFKDHEKAPKNENLLKTICRYAVKITDIYELLDEKPKYWFDPVVIKQLMESDVYDPEMWLYTICGNMDNLAFLKELVRFILSAEDVCKQKALEAERKHRELELLEKKREQVRELMRMGGLL
jgi:hypothetical protein